MTGSVASARPDPSAGPVRTPRPFWRLKWRLLSVPLYTKILSVVIVAAVLFGAVTLYQVWSSTVSTQEAIWRERAEALASGLSRSLEQHDPESARRHLQIAARMAVDAFADCSYVVIRDESGLPIAQAMADSLGSREAASTREWVVPLTGPVAGTLHLGLQDVVIDREMGSIVWPLFWTLAICLLVCEALALVLARILVRPIHDLVDATERIRQGDFDSRAPVHSDDEIGRLASAFNTMADALRASNQAVEEKEAARQSLIAKLVQAQEEERMVLSRELHDQLGQTLSKVLLSLQSIHKECACVSFNCANVETEVRDAIDEVRRLAWSMRPSILDDYGIEAALGRYTQELSRRVEFPIDYQCFALPEADRLPSAIEVTLYRVAQEAMTNVIRHAQPTRASVVLLRRSAEVTLMVEDDGRGFDPESPRSDGVDSLGLLGMRERVALVGGTLAIESRPGNGTSIRAQIPLKRNVEQDALCRYAS